MAALISPTVVQSPQWIVQNTAGSTLRIVILDVRKASAGDTVDVSAFGFSSVNAAFFLSITSGVRGGCAIAGTVLTLPASLPTAPSGDFGHLLVAGS
jgi:hypothetical protein